MEPAGVQKHDEARKRLLEEGTRSYLEAVTALIEYQREVQKKCRTVMETRLDDYAAALKVRFRSSEILTYDLPSLTKWEGDWWSIGVRIVRKDIPRIRWWEASCCLQYESGDNGLFCWIGEWFPTRNMAADLSEKFHRLNRKVLHEGKDVWIEHRLKLEDVGAFEESLEGLVDQWIGLWKKVGGIKEVFRKAVAKEHQS